MEGVVLEVVVVEEMVVVMVVEEMVEEVEEAMELDLVEVVALPLLYSVACQDQSCGRRHASLVFGRRFTCCATSARIGSFLGGSGTFCSSHGVPLRNVRAGGGGGVKAGVSACGRETGKQEDRKN